MWEPVTQAVITVPAYFNDSQRNATKAAGEIAGLKVERIINEPTARSLAYGEWKNKNEKIVVFDLWGELLMWRFWKLDQKVLSKFYLHPEILNLRKGFWSKIINYLIDAFKTKEGIDLRWDAMAMQRLKDEAEKAKMQLSQVERVDIMIPFICTDDKWQPKT